MEKKSVTKRITTIRPDGSVRTGFMSAMFMDTEEIRRDIDTEEIRYSSYPGVQSIEMSSSAWVLAVTYHDGTVTVITYSDN